MSNSVPTFLKPVYLFARDTGAVGVDIFMFYSGLGCYYSMIKNNNVLSFYKRRFIRIYPSFLIVMIPFLAYIDLAKSGETFGKYLYDLSLVGFWIDGNAVVWFVAAILFLYLIYPIIHKLITTYSTKTVVIITMSVWLVLSMIIFCFFNSAFYNITRLIARIPIFLLGCIMAKYVKSGGVKINARKLIYISLTVFVVSIATIWFVYNNQFTVFISSFVRRFLYTPLTISMIFIVSYLLFKLPNLTSWLLQSKFVKITALMTFELYLVHERVILFGKELFEKYGVDLDKYRILNDLIYFVVAFGVSYFVYFISSYIQKIFKKGKRCIINE